MTLARLNKLRDELIALRNEKEEFEIKADSIPGGQFNGMPSAKSSGNSKEQRYISLIHDKETILEVKCKRIELKYAEEIKYIANIKNETSHAIFMYRFLYGWEWKRVAEKISEQMSADSVRMYVTRYLKNN